MQVKVEELFKFHQEELSFWENNIPIDKFFKEIGFQNVSKEDRLIIASKVVAEDEDILDVTAFDTGTKIWESYSLSKSSKKVLNKHNTGDLIDLGKLIYIPEHINRGYLTEATKNISSPEVMGWYTSVMRIESRNNIRKLLIQQEESADLFVNKEPLVSKIVRETFYAPRLEIYKIVKQHEANLAEGLTFHFGSDPLVSSIEEGLDRMFEFEEAIKIELTEFTSKHNMPESVVKQMVDIAHKHLLPIYIQRDFISFDPVEYIIRHASKTDRGDFSY